MEETEARDSLETELGFELYPSVSPAPTLNHFPWCGRGPEKHASSCDTWGRVAGVAQPGLTISVFFLGVDALHSLSARKGPIRREESADRMFLKTEEPLSRWQ